MITGDTSASAGADLVPKSPVTSILDTNSDGFLTILLNDNTNATASLVGKNVTVSGIGTTETGDDDDLELAVVNATHSITAHNVTGLLLTTSTTFDVADFVGTVNGTASIKVGGGGYDLKESNDVSYSFLQTQGLEYASRYDGMMAQSATISVSPDDVASVDISFLGKDEQVTRVSDNYLANLFQGHNTSDGGESWTTSYAVSDSPTPDVNNNPLSVTSNRITKLKSNQAGTFDNFVDYYPSYNCALYIAKKALTYTNKDTAGTPTYYNLDGGVGDDGYNATAGTWNTETTAPDSDFLIPFADLSLTINNNMEFPSYVNGTKNRTKPIQTTFKEVTVSATFPYNEYLTPLVRDVFGNQSFAMKLVCKSDDGSLSIVFEMPEVCVTGDGGLGDIPEGEITIPLTFTAYSAVEMSGASSGEFNYSAIEDKPPLRIWVDES